MQAGDYLLRFPFRFHLALCLLGSRELGDHAAQWILNFLAKKASIVACINDGQGDGEILCIGRGRVQIALAGLTPPVDFPNGTGFDIAKLD